MTNNGLWRFVWDSENRLVQAQSLSSVPSNAWRTVEHAYDFAGRRVQTILSNWNGAAYVARSTNRFIYDGMRVMGIVDHQSELLKTFLWGMDLGGAGPGEGGGAAGIGGLVAMTIHSGALAGTYFYHDDGHGNVAGLSPTEFSDVIEFVGRYAYEPA